MEPIPSRSHPECTNVVRISNLQQRETKSVIWLTAKDKRSGQTLTAEVTIGKISKIEIFSRFRQIPKGDRQELQVRGQDDEGNVFSTLSGFSFDWTEVSGGKNIMRISRDDAEQRGSKPSYPNQHPNNGKNDGDYFLKARENGYTTLKVVMLEQGYEHLAPGKITLTIVDPFIILPAEVDEDQKQIELTQFDSIFILPTSEFDFKLALITNREKQGTELQQIKIPSQKYSWEISKKHSSLGSINKNGQLKSLTKPGRVEIKVTDQDFKNNTAEAEIFIVEPFKVQLEIADVTEAYQKQAVTNSKQKVSSFKKQLNVTEWAHQWILVEEKYYLIKVNLYDKDHNKIFQTKELNFKTSFQEKHFEMIHQNLIGSEIILKVKPMGLTGSQGRHAKKTILKSALNEIKSSSYSNKYSVDSNKLKDEKEITITEPVQIVHPVNYILLPYTNGQKDGQIWYLKATGGTGSFQWSSENTQVATIGQPPHAIARQIGVTTLTVSDHHNSDNFATITLEVQPVHYLRWLQDRVEAVSQKHLESSQSESKSKAKTSNSNGVSSLNSIAVDNQGRSFTNCTSLDLIFDVKGEGTWQDEPLGQNWEYLQKYVHDKKTLNLIQLYYRFDQQPKASFQSELQGQVTLTEDKIKTLQQNSFGICQQIKVKTSGVGLSRVKASFQIQERTIESKEAEIASYQELKTVNPNYDTFLADLYSRSQSGQEHQSFAGFAPQFDAKSKLMHFVLSFGSTIDWELSGGSNFWKELSGEYQISWSIETKKGTIEDVLSLSKKSESATGSVLSLRCGTPQDLKNLNNNFDYVVKVSQKGRVSRNLLQPQIHEDSILISCMPPQSQRLLWCQQSLNDTNSNLAILPRSRLENNVRTQFILVNTQQYVRLLILDKHSRASLNHSSIITEISSSNPSLASISSINEDYDKRVVQIHNQTGTIYLNSISVRYNANMMNNAGQKTGYFSRSSASQFKDGLYVNHPVKDSMRIDIVENVDITPRFKSIYFQGNKNPFKFHLSKGSGHFVVKMNDTTEQLAYVKAVGRDVTIIPRSEGSLLITVEDVELPESKPVTAELLISSVAKLQLDTQGYLIEQGSSTNMTATAYDNYGVEFEEDQYDQMNFELEIETTDIQMSRSRSDKSGGLGLQTTHVIGNRRKFTLTGIEPGHYGVTAYTDKFNQNTGWLSGAQKRVTSTGESKIEVFPALMLYPENLLLTPRMRYTLDVRGGPSRGSLGANAGGGHVNFNFDIEDENVASIDSFREITGQHEGDTILRIQVYHIIETKERKDGQEWRSVVSEKKVKVKVRLVTSIAIPENQQRIVYTGSLLKQIAVLKFNNETFSHGIAPISFSWNCSNPDILEPNPITLDPKNFNDNQQNSERLKPLKNQMSSKVIRDNYGRNNGAVFTSTFNSSSIHAKAVKSGEAILQVKMAIEYPDAYRNKPNWFDTNALLKVQDRLAVLVPEFIPDADKQTHLYLLPPRTLTKIATNKKTSLKLGYSMQSIYDSSTQRFEYRESKTPIIELINNEAIRTLDKYGKVTVHIAEDQSHGDQVVMLNVLITDIYSLSATHKHNFYEALNLPLGSSLEMPIKFQNEHAHLFANGIEGVRVGIELSHPRVVTAELDRYNSKLTLQSQGSGECNVVLYLIENPSIFDVFKVKVATLVQPGSPVHLHLGSEVNFKIVSDSLNQLSRGGVKWSSGEPSVLSIDVNKGSAKALDEGSAHIMLSGQQTDINVQAASIAHISKVTHIEVEQNGSKDLLLDVDDNSKHLRIRLKLYLRNQVEEVMPIIQFDGTTLIKQNINLKCETDQPKIVEARAEVNNAEGYFCNIRYIGSNKNGHKETPQRARITATVSSSTTNTSGKKVNLYKTTLPAFDITLVGQLLVDKQHRKGVKIGQYSRTKQLVVYSLADLDVRKDLDDKTLRVSKSRDPNSNKHTIEITIPRSVSDTFNSDITLVNRITDEKIRIPVSYDPLDNSGSVYDESVKHKPSNQTPIEQPTMVDTSESQKQTPSSSEPGATSWILFLFTACAAWMLCSMFYGRDLNSVIQSLGVFTSISSWLAWLNGQHAGGYRGGDGDRSRSFYSALGPDASRFGSSRDSINPYQQVRNRLVGSPDARAKKKDAPYNRFQQSRGSVVSPQSMYRPVGGNDSMFRDSGY